MTTWTVQSGNLRGECALPGDKSISHRALILGGIAQGESRVRGFLDGGDCRATLGIMQALGIGVDEAGGEEIVVTGRGLDGLTAPARDLDCKSSGTTMRLLAGLLAGQRFRSVLTGSAQLRKRPMQRVIDPLQAMGAWIEGKAGRAPLEIDGGPLKGIRYELPVASAQVKSCVLLAGLYAEGTTEVVEPGPARDHTEVMLEAMGVSLRHADRTVGVSRPDSPLAPLDLLVPGDVSSAAFLLVAASIAAGSELTLTGVGVNPTRTGILDALTAMGASLETRSGAAQGGEPVADLHVQSARLTGTELAGPVIVRMIDELPVLAVAATQAEGETVVRDAAELRVKETDRIATTVSELRKLGAVIEARPDGLVVRGPTQLTGARVDSHGDHRLAMALVVAGLVASGETQVSDAQVASDSFPGFIELLRSLGATIEAAL